MNGRIGLVLAIISTATLSLSTLVLAGGGGSVITFDDPDFISDFRYDEDGIVVTSVEAFSFLTDEGGDKAVEVFGDAGNESIAIMRLDLAAFELTSIDLESVSINPDFPNPGIIVRGYEGGPTFIQIFSEPIIETGTAELNWSGVTKVTITGVGSISTVDNIVIDGGVNGGPGGGRGGVNGGGGSHGGNKADKVEICHVNEGGDANLISINRNALEAHINHGDFLPDPSCSP